MAGFFGLGNFEKEEFEYAYGTSPFIKHIPKLKDKGEPIAFYVVAKLKNGATLFNVMSIEDLKAGMELKGTVRNVIDFGAFVDVGVHQDGLVHISQITNRYIKHPSEILKVGDIVTVWVIEADSKRNRISLTMKNPNK